MKRTAAALALVAVLALSAGCGGGQATTRPAKPASSESVRCAYLHQRYATVGNAQPPNPGNAQQTMKWETRGMHQLDRIFKAELHAGCKRIDS